MKAACLLLVCLAVPSFAAEGKTEQKALTAEALFAKHFARSRPAATASETVGDFRARLLQAHAQNEALEPVWVELDPLVCRVAYDEKESVLSVSLLYPPLPGRPHIQIGEKASGRFSRKPEDREYYQLQVKNLSQIDDRLKISVPTGITHTLGAKIPMDAAKGRAMTAVDEKGVGKAVRVRLKVKLKDLMESKTLPSPPPRVLQMPALLQGMEIKGNGETLYKVEL